MLNEEERLRRTIPPLKKFHIVMDADAGNEIDDQFAIAWALRSEDRFKVDAIYAAPFSHTAYRHNAGDPDYPDNELPGDTINQSVREIGNVLEALHLKNRIPVYKGSSAFLENAYTPVESEAAENLIKRCMAAEEPLYIVATGAATNIASTIIKEPAIVDKAVLVWLGGQPLYFGHGTEFNLGQDPIAAKILFDSGIPMIWVPCMTVASQLLLTENDVQQLLGKNDICDYLGNIVLRLFGSVDKAINRANTQHRFNLRGQDDMDSTYLAGFQSGFVSWSRSIWDISTIAFLKNPNWALSTIMPSPILNNDFSWSVRETRHKIRIVHYLQRNLIMGDMIACLQEEMKNG